MNFCTECGAKRVEGQQFCTKCGAAFQDSKNVNESKATESDTNAQAVKQALSKRTKVMLAIAGSVLLIFFVVYQWLSSQYDPVKMLQAMDDAIIEDDSKAFLQHIEFDKKAIIDEEQYFQYIKKYEWKTVKPQLIDLIESKQQASFDLTIKSTYGSDLFKVKPKKKFGLFSTYVFRAIPSTLNVYSTMEETNVTIKKETFTVKNYGPHEIKKIYQGKYTFEAKAQNLFGEFQEKKEFLVDAKSENELYIEFPTDVYGIESDQMDAILFVNGKSTKKTLKELGVLGPFPNDKEVKMHAEWKTPKGKVMKTKTVTPEDAYFGTLYFEFGYDDYIEYDSYSAGDHVLNFRDAYEQALNSKDYSFIASFIQTGSAAEKELKKFISDLEDMQFHYEFTDNQIIDTEMVDDVTYQVTTREKFTYTHYEKGKEEVTDYDREKIYHVKETDDGYKITKIEYKETDRNKK